MATAPAVPPRAAALADLSCAGGRVRGRWGWVRGEGREGEGAGGAGWRTMICPNVSCSLFSSDMLVVGVGGGGSGGRGGGGVSEGCGRRREPSGCPDNNKTHMGSTVRLGCGCGVSGQHLCGRGRRGEVGAGKSREAPVVTVCPPVPARQRGNSQRRGAGRALGSRAGPAQEPCRVTKGSDERDAETGFQSRTRQAADENELSACSPAGLRVVIEPDVAASCRAARTRV